MASTPISTGPYTGQYGPTTPAFTNVRINVQIRSSGFGQVNRVFMAGLDQGDISDNTFTPSVEFGLKFAAFNSPYQWGEFMGGTKQNFPNRRRPQTDHVNCCARRRAWKFYCHRRNSGLVAGDVVRISAPSTLVQGIQGYKIVHQVPTPLHFLLVVLV